MQLLTKQPNYEFLKPILTIVNNNKNMEKQNIEANIRSYKSSLDYNLKTAESYKKSIEDCEKQLAKVEVKNWEMQELIAAMEQLKKNKKIKWAFVDKACNLIVLTEMLYAYNSIDGIQTEEPVGRYIFKIDLRSLYICVYPIDFESQGFRHPNIMSMGNVCWGGTDSTLVKMLKIGEFYNAIDTMLFFFSAFPHDGGHRPLYWLVWLNEREIKFKLPDYVKNERLLTIGRFSKPRKIKIEVEKKEVITFQKKEYNIKGSNFRNYS